MGNTAQERIWSLITFGSNEDVYLLFSGNLVPNWLISLA